MRRLCLSAMGILAGVLFAANFDAVAQDGFVVLQYSAAPTLRYEYRWVGEDGVATATVGRLPASTFAVQSVVAPDNLSVRVLARGPFPTRGSLIDIHPSGKVTTVVSGGLIANPHMVFPGRDGDAFIINDHGTRVELLHLANSTLTTFRNIPLITPTGCAIDPKTGHVALRGFSRSGGINFGYFFLDPHTGNVTTVSTPTNYSSIGATRIGFDVATDTFVDLRPDYLAGSVDFVRFDRQKGIVSTYGLTVGQRAYVVDMVAASNRGRAIKHWAMIRALYGPTYLLGLRGDGSIAQAKQLNGMTGYVYKMMRAFSENVGIKLNAAPNDRTLKVSFPAEPGKRYAVLCSMTGYMNGPRLPDGRILPITIDALTVASLGGGLPGILGPTTGILDANGEAQVRIDANGFGPAASGMKLWAAAVVLDPSAPSGIVEIAGPRVIVMN